MTYDQILILAARKTDLAASSTTIVAAVDEMRAIGKVPTVPDGQPRSLVQRIRAKNQTDKKQRSARELKRQRRKEHADAIMQARARGKKI